MISKGIFLFILFPLKYKLLKNSIFIPPFPPKIGAIILSFSFQNIVKVLYQEFEFWAECIFFPSVLYVCVFIHSVEFSADFVLPVGILDAEICTKASIAGKAKPFGLLTGHESASLGYRWPVKSIKSWLEQITELMEHWD